MFSLLTRLKKDASLHQYVPSILFAWHLIYEVFITKQNVLLDALVTWNS